MPQDLYSWKITSQVRFLEGGPFDTYRFGVSMKLPRWLEKIVADYGGYFWLPWPHSPNPWDASPQDKELLDEIGQACSWVYGPGGLVVRGRIPLTKFRRSR